MTSRFFGRCIGFDHHQTDDHGDVTQRIAEKAPAFADAGDQQTADAWADRSRAINHRRIQRDRAHQIFFRDQLCDECLPHGKVKRIDDAKQGRDHEDMPDLNPSRERKQGQHKGQHHRRDLCDKEDASF